MKTIFPQSLIEFAQKSPNKIYAVGGFLRNYFSGLPFAKTDIDLCGIAPAKDLGVEYRIVSKDLGTAIVTIGQNKYEYTPFRSEEYTGGKHTPDNITLGVDIKTDAYRRDFTVGCIYYCLNDDTIFDPYGGIEDAKNKILRQIHSEVFKSDGLRLLRMVRIAGETGFEIDEQTFATAKSQAYLLNDISPERKRMELQRMLVADTLYGVKEGHYNSLVYTEKAGLFEYFIPEIVQMRDFPQNPIYHKYDVMWHTFNAVRFAHTNVRLAALLHDIAKPLCKLRDGNMHKHAYESADMAKDIMQRLRYSNKEIEYVCRLIYNHMYDLKGQASFNKVKLFVAKNMDIIDDLMLLNLADALGTGMHNEDLHKFDKAKAELLAQGAPYNLSMLKIDGNVLEKIGFCGSQIKSELIRLQTTCILDAKLNNAEWLINAAKRDFTNIDKIVFEE